MKFTQDFKQKIKSSLYFFKEIYRVVMGSFLISWVPHKCNQCMLMDEIKGDDGIVSIGQYSNITTFIFILALYCIEMKREFKLIDYLEVNNELPRDDSSVGERLLQLDVKERNAIWRIDKLYQNFFNFSFLAFIVNCILSGVIIFSEHGEVSKTKSVFITNTLFLFMKFTSIYYVKKSDKNVFYSAYLTKKIQFNDVDPDKIFTEQNTI